jgi:hypothetical protein
VVLTTFLGVSIVASCILDRDGGLAPYATSSTGAGGTGACVDASDCGEDTACSAWLCEPDGCAAVYASAGTPCAFEGGTRCDGGGHCVNCVRAEDCAPGSCQNGVQNGGETCMAGECVPVESMPCAPYVCGEDVCLTDCTSGTHAACTNDNYCDRNTDSCVPKKRDSLGCDSSPECQSGLCQLGSCVPCGTVPNPAPGCPPACTGGCSDTICNIACATDDSCKTTVVCPAGMHCNVTCTGQRACQGATILCPETYACEVTCGSGAMRCMDATINCSGQGACLLRCEGGDACSNAVLECGDNSCSALCSGGGADPLQDCGTSCGCTTSC